jgi:hypothetical protein
MVKEVMGGWRYPHTEEFYDIYRSPYIIQAVKNNEHEIEGHVGYCRIGC